MDPQKCSIQKINKTLPLNQIIQNEPQISMHHNPKKKKNNNEKLNHLFRIGALNTHSRGRAATRERTGHNSWYNQASIAGEKTFG